MRAGASRKDHLVRALKNNVRYDGRKPDEFRPVEVRKGISASAEGSAQVTIGKTVIMAGVKMAVETPYPDTQDRGNLMVNAELLPLSSPNFDQGPPGIMAIEVARVVDRGIRESRTIDQKKLCITVGEKVWSVMIDLVTINDDGNLIDAGALAALAALQDTKFPKYEDGVINYEEHGDALTLEHSPVTVTVFKIGDTLVVDPIREEENETDARLTVCSEEDGTLCALQKGGSAPLSVDEISKIVDITAANAKQLREKLG